MEEEKREECTSTGCFCGDPENCKEMQGHKRLTYCAATECLWNVSIKPGKDVPHHKGWEPMTNDPAYKGICGRRGGAGLSPETLQSSTNPGAERQIVKCDHHSYTGLKGHIDFAKMLQSDGTPYGGNLDSNSSGSYEAYGTQ